MSIHKKSIALVAIAHLTVATINAQQADVTISQTLTGNQLINATNSITFLPGFSYDAQSIYQLMAWVTPPVNNFNYSFIPPMESGNLPTNTNYPVGSLGGSLTVGPSGAANYVIPIDIPPGRNGMKPSLSLVYNSQGGDGMLGLGWALSGLSLIARVSADFYHEGFIDPVDFDSNDRFALDGQRLISIGGDQYRTEKETFSKITLYGASTNPTYFKVETKEGLELYYGNTIDSRARAKGTSKFYAWNLNKVRDKNGNYYDITYIQDTVQCEIYPVSIEYSGYGSSSGDYKIEFGYENRTVSILTFIGGSPFQINKLMNLVTIKYGTTVISKMQLIYSDYKLTEIVKFGKNNTRLNSTYVNWGNADHGLVESDRPRIRTLTLRFQGDFNGDGRTDLIVFSGGADTCSLFLADHTGQLHYFSSQILPSNYVSTQIYPGDYNGDGRDDLMIFRLINNAYYISYLTLSGTSLIKIDDPSSLGFNTNIKFLTGDFNGDWKTDLMLKPPGTTNCVIYSTTFQFDGSTSRTLIANSQISWGSSNALTKVKDVPFDMNGDGKTDLMVMDLTETRFYTLAEGTLDMTLICSTPNTDNTKTNLFGDFNGDGMTDILVLYSYLLISRGNSFVTDYCPFETLSSAYNNIYTYDMNGDGRCDIVIVGKWASSNNPVKIYVEYSDGYNTSSHRFSFHLQTYNPVSTLKYSPIVDFYDSYNRFGDYNGDGVIDFYYEDGIITRLINTYRGRSQYFVSEIKNGFGYSSHLNYGPMTADSLYYKGTSTSFPVVSFQAPLYVVSSIAVDNPDFSHNTTYYSYVGAHMHALGKGFLGFETITSRNPSLNLKNVEQYEYHTTFYDVALKTRKNYILPLGSSSEELISGVSFINQWSSLGNSTFWTYVTSATESDYLKGSSVTKTFGYNINYGNLTSYREDFDDGSYNSTAYTNFSSDGTWLPAKPQTVTNTKKHYQHAQSFTSTTTFTYYSATGQVNTKTVNPLTSTYTYDNYGNLIGIMITDRVTSRTSHYTYDSKNMFVKKSYNALDHVTSRTYDYATGNVLTETLPDSVVVVNYTYDDFGTLITRSVPALGQSKSYTYGWAIGTRPFGSIYYRQIVTSGAPATKEYFDAFGRVICREVVEFDGSPVSTNIVYNNLGQVSEMSLPYKSSDPKFKTLFFYDIYGQKIKEASPTGIANLGYLGKTIQTSLSSGQTSSKTYDSQGNVITSSDDVGSVNYSYKSVGKPGSITANGATWSMIYDNLGRQTSLGDPDAGTMSYTYNNFNELIKQVDSRGNTDSLSYDAIGRIVRKYGAEGTKMYSYDPAGKPGVLSSITYPGGSETYNYDSYARLTSKVTNIDGVDYTISYGYDSYGRMETTTYPSGFAVKNVFNTYGYLSEVRRNDNNSLIWKGLSANSFGQLTQYQYGNNLTTARSYDSYGILTGIHTGAVQNMGYSFNTTTGNITSRTDNLRSLTETFSYDNLNRMTSVSGPASLTMTYAANGNINSKTSIGTYSYDGVKPHAVTGVTNPDGIISDVTQRITYNSFNKVDSIIQADLVYTILYGADNQRTISKLYNGGSLQKTAHYVDRYEKEIRPGNQVRQLHYIAGGDDLAAVFVRNNGLDTMYYVHTDHLGSINVITNQAGAVVKNYSFDAWGNRRNPTNWTYSNIPATFLFSRGFTGHEHLDKFALINMNGRIYDPMLGRFLSPDPFVQMPFSSQSFNRYAYCLNNPLRYTDPDGEWFITLLFTLGNAYYNGFMANNFELNPVKWDWKSIPTYSALASGLISGYSVGSKAEKNIKEIQNDPKYKWHDNETFSLPPTEASPSGELPLLAQDPSGGCAYKVCQSMNSYAFPFDFPLNSTEGADYTDVARSLYGDTRPKWTEGKGDLRGIGKELAAGYPSALTYPSGDNLNHVVGIQRLTIQSKFKLIIMEGKEIVKYRGKAEVMDPMYNFGYRTMYIVPGSKAITHIESYHSGLPIFLLFNFLWPAF
jgi:RHS repeat-associated protein